MTLIRANEKNGRQNGFVSPFSPVFNNLFEDFLGGKYAGSELNAKQPAVNIVEGKDSFKVQLAVPGLNKDDFNINLDENRLSVKVEKKEEQSEEGKTFTRREFSYHSFNRSFTLPDTVDGEKIDAQYKEGILEIILPKKEELKAKNREIKIS